MVSARLYWAESESDIASRWLHGESNLMFKLSSEKDQRKIHFLRGVNEPLDDKTGENHYFRHYEPLVAMSPNSEEKHLVQGTNIKQEESDDETQDAKVKITNMHVWFFKGDH